MDPVQFTILRLENRRVLDVTASFITATGQLEVQLGAAGDEAMVNSDTNGDLAITDQNGLSIFINPIGGGPAGPIAVDQVRGVNVAGTPATDQSVRFKTDLLSLSSGLTVQSDVEVTTLASDLNASGAALRFGGEVVLEGNVRLTADKIDFNSRIETSTGGARILSLDAAGGSIDFGGDIGTRGRLGALRVLHADRVSFGSAGSPLRLVRTFGPINLGQSSIVGSGGAGDGIFFFGPNDGTSLNVSTGGGDIRINGATGVAGGLSLASGIGNGGEILFSSAAPLDGLAGQPAANVTVNALDSRVTFNADIGTGQALGRLAVLRADGGVTFGGQDVDSGPVQAVNRIVTANGIDLGRGANEIAGGIVFNGGDGELLTIVVTNLDADARFNGPVTLESDVRVATQSGDATFTRAAAIDGDVAEHHALTLALMSGRLFLNADIGSNRPLEAFTVETAAGVFLGQAPAIGHADAGPVEQIRTIGPIAIGSIDTIAGAGIVFSDNAAGGISRPIALRTSGAPISLDAAAIQVVGPIELDTTGDGAAAGADVTVDGPLRPTNAAASVFRLTIDAGDGGDVLFLDRIENPRTGDLLSIRNANNVTFRDTVSIGAIEQLEGQSVTRFQGPLTLLAVAADRPAADLNAASIEFQGQVMAQGDGAFLTTVDDRLTIEPAADFQLGGNFRQDGGVVELAGDIAVPSGATMTFQGEVTLTGDVRLTGGDITFAAPLRSQTPLDDLQITTAENVAFDASVDIASLVQLDGTGETSFAWPVRLTAVAGVGGATSAIQTRSIRVEDNFETTAAGARVDWSAADSISLDGMLRTNDGNVTWDAAGTVTMADGALVDTSAGRIEITAVGDIQIGRLRTSTVVRVASADGALTDGGDQGGADVVAAAARLEAATGIGADNPLETDVPLLAAHNRESGGVRLQNLLGTGAGGTLAIGHVEGLAGVTNGPVDGADATAAEGLIEIVNAGAVHVVASVQNNAGGDTTLRAELPADPTLSADLTLDQPVQNRGGNGSLLLFAGGDLVINDSLPEFVGGDPSQPFPEAEVSVENEGVIRGQAGGDVLVAAGDTGFAIIRTHAERFPDPATIPTLPARFQDPATFPSAADDPQFYDDLEIALAEIRNAVSPQATNVAPLLEIEAIDRGGSTIDAQGRAILRITIGDDVHLERNFSVTVDWGDGVIENYSIPGNPQASRGFILASGTRINGRPDATITASFNSGEVQADGATSPGVYFVHHTYTAPPDPDDAAKPIPVRVEVRYDPRVEPGPGPGDRIRQLDAVLPPTGSSVLNGIRFFENLTDEVFTFADTEFRAPGEGSFQFIKVVESEIVPIQRRDTPPVAITTSTVTTSEVVSLQYDLVVSQAEDDRTTGFRLYFVVVDDVRETESERQFDVPLDALADPIGLFTQRFDFPNGHYRLYLQDLQTDRSRLILDVHIYEGRVVPPNFQAGEIERQPGGNVPEVPVPEVPADASSQELPAAPAPGDDAAAPADLPGVTTSAAVPPAAETPAGWRAAQPIPGMPQPAADEPAFPGERLDAALAAGVAVFVMRSCGDAKCHPGAAPRDVQRWLSRAARVTRQLRRENEGTLPATRHSDQTRV